MAVPMSWPPGARLADESEGGATDGPLALDVERRLFGTRWSGEAPGVLGVGVDEVAHSRPIGGNSDAMASTSPL